MIWQCLFALPGSRRITPSTQVIKQLPRIQLQNSSLLSLWVPPSNPCVGSTINQTPSQHAAPPKVSHTHTLCVTISADQPCGFISGRRCETISRMPATAAAAQPAAAAATPACQAATTDPAALCCPDQQQLQQGPLLHLGYCRHHLRVAQRHLWPGQHQAH